MAEINSSLTNIPLTFEVYPAALLGAKFTNFTITSILSAVDAAEFEDIAVLHKQVYPYLPEGTVENNYRAYQYVRGVTQDGTRRILGIPWIKADSIIPSGSSSLFIRIDGVVPNAETIANAKRGLYSFAFTQITASSEPLGLP